MDKFDFRLNARLILHKRISFFIQGSGHGVFDAHVTVEVAPLAEREFALLALVDLFLKVGSHVIVEFEQIGESRPADAIALAAIDMSAFDHSIVRPVILVPLQVKEPKLVSACNLVLVTHQNRIEVGAVNCQDKVVFAQLVFGDELVMEEVLNCAGQRGTKLFNIFSRKIIAVVRMLLGDLGLEQSS